MKLSNTISFYRNENRGIVFFMHAWNMHAYKRGFQTMRKRKQEKNDAIVEKHKQLVECVEKFMKPCTFFVKQQKEKKEKFLL